MSNPYDNGRSGWASHEVSDLFVMMDSYDRLPTQVRRLMQEAVVPWNPDSVRAAARTAARDGFAPREAWQFAIACLKSSEQEELLDFGASQWGGQSCHQRAGATIQRYGLRGYAPQRTRQRRFA